VLFTTIVNQNQFVFCLNPLNIFIYTQSALSKSSKQLSIFNDYREVRTNVTKSNIMMYGDFEIGSEKLSSFIGYHENSDEVSRYVQKSIIKVTILLFAL